MNELILPTRFCPSPAYYRAMILHQGPVSICHDERFNKRCKVAHRTTIADTRGSLELTVPIEKPYGSTWNDTRVSLHGRWWEVMTSALESAYGRTPYFEFYADDFLPIIANPDEFTSVAALNARFDAAIRKAIGLNRAITEAPKGSRISAIEPWEPQPYWQVRAQRLGFIGGLSILDMVFNLGPETLLYLQR
jgi:hypothetical protein